jgi:hypothetical protein
MSDEKSISEATLHAMEGWSHQGNGRYEMGNNKLLGLLLTMIAVLGCGGIGATIVMYGQVKAQEQAIADLRETIIELKGQVAILMERIREQPQR